VYLGRQGIALELRTRDGWAALYVSKSVKSKVNFRSDLLTFLPSVKTYIRTFHYDKSDAKYIKDILQHFLF